MDFDNRWLFMESQSNFRFVFVLLCLLETPTEDVFDHDGDILALDTVLGSVDDSVGTSLLHWLRVFEHCLGTLGDYNARLD
jgi:hypothetical protein